VSQASERLKADAEAARQRQKAIEDAHAGLVRASENIEPALAKLVAKLDAFRAAKGALAALKSDLGMELGELSRALDIYMTDALGLGKSTIDRDVLVNWTRRIPVVS